MIPDTRGVLIKPQQPDENQPTDVIKPRCQRRPPRSETTTLTLAKGSFEPFKAFPIDIDKAFVNLFERYYRGYRWDAYKPGLFRETVSDRKLYHSFLAIAYNMFALDKIKAIEHETEAIKSISEALMKVKVGDQDEASSKEAITWAMSRLAMIRSQQGDWETALKHINACALTCNSISELAAYSRIHGIKAQLRRPYGDTGRSALADVESLGFKLPLSTLLALKHLNMGPQLLDALCALIALCHPAKRNPVFYDTLGIQQAVELLKLAVRLAEMCADLKDDSPASNYLQWRMELQACMRLTSFLFLLCPSPAAQAAVEEVRQRLTEGLLEHITGNAPTTGEQATSITPLSILLLWLLLVCSTSALQRDDQLYFPEVMKKYYPYVADISESAIENWKLNLPLLGVGSNSPPDCFFRLSGQKDLVSGETGYIFMEMPPSPGPVKSSRPTLEEIDPGAFSIEEEFLSF